MTEFAFLAAQHLDTVITAGEVDQNTASAIQQVIRALQSSEKEHDSLRAKLEVAVDLIWSAKINLDTLGHAHPLLPEHPFYKIVKLQIEEALAKIKG